MSDSWNREVKTDSAGLFRVDVDSHYEEGDLRFLTVSDGQEVPRMAQVDLAREDDDVSWERMKVKAVTDEAGGFELRGVTPGTELHVSASLAGKRGESIVARVGDTGVLLVLYGTGGSRVPCCWTRGFRTIGS